MKLAVIGSRTIENINIEAFIPDGVTEIVSGGAKGADRLAEEYAAARGLPVKLFLPDYDRYGRAAPIRRNQQIAEYADEALAFWDGKSKGTRSCIDFFKKQGKPMRIVTVKAE